MIGIAGYVLILASAAVPGEPGRFGGFVTAMIGFGFSLYLTYLELFVIDAICQWCVASAVLMTLSFAFDQPSSIDLALTLALLSAPGTLILALFEERWL